MWSSLQMMEWRFSLQHLRAFKSATLSYVDKRFLYVAARLGGHIPSANGVVGLLAGADCWWGRFPPGSNAASLLTNCPLPLLNSFSNVLHVYVRMYGWAQRLREGSIEHQWKAESYLVYFNKGFDVVSVHYIWIMPLRRSLGCPSWDIHVFPSFGCWELQLGFCAGIYFSPWLHWCSSPCMSFSWVVLLSSGIMPMLQLAEVCRLHVQENSYWAM